MKKLILALIVSGSGMAFAFDTTLNPDGAVSIGITYHSETVSGGYGPTLNSSEYLEVGEREYDTQKIVFDVIVPITNRLSLNASLGAVQLEETFDSNDTSIALNDISDMDGGSFSLGVRYYFVK